MEKSYDQSSEKNTYALWESSEILKANSHSEKSPFTIVLPPPNVTGVLHMGHAVGNTIQDAMIRYKKMKGFEALWVPGTDHAAIATENVVLKSLGMKKREELPRERFLEECKRFAQEKHDRICDQMKSLGSFLDWSREAYTLDEARSNAVATIFKMLWEDGLITRGYRMVNWSVGAQSVLADDEVIHKEIEGFLYQYRYDIVEFPGESLIVSTTRPETIFGDTAVALNPSDQRLKKYKNCHIKLPFSGREIPIIADDHVDINFGTATLKVTPAHDPNDFEIGKTHNLPEIQVIGFDGKMKDIPEVPKEFRLLTREECRQKLTEKNEWYLGKTPHTQSVGHCYRTNTIVEPMLSEQWFISVNKEFTDKFSGEKTTLKELTLNAVKSGEVRLIPNRFDKIYYQWIENLRDWCISRQIWWGHRMPVWYGERDGKTEISIGSDEELKNKNATNIRQEEDTLDTWFSSALWPFSTLGWPATSNPDFQKFYPTDVLETAHDILFFWVARMIMFGKYATGKAPFHTVYLHGIVTDEKGKKMSKTAGNGIDPVDMIEKFGADAVRLSLVIGTTPGSPMPIGETKIAGYRNFINKLWNAGRFVKMQWSETFSESDIPKSLADKWILSRFSSVSKEIEHHFNKYEISYAGDKIYHFVWNEFCDWYIEASKIEPSPEFLKYIFGEILKLTHPLCPFITETLWQELFRKNLLIAQNFPQTDFKDEETEQTFSLLQKITTELRKMRAEKKLNPKEKFPISIYGNQKEILSIEKWIKSLSNISEIHFKEKIEKPDIVETDFQIFLELEIKKDQKEKEIKLLTEQIEKLKIRLSNKSYIEKAPKALVEETKKELFNAEEKLKKLQG